MLFLLISGSLGCEKPVATAAATAAGGGGGGGGSDCKANNETRLSAVAPTVVNHASSVSLLLQLKSLLISSTSLSMGARMVDRFRQPNGVAETRVAVPDFE